MLVEWVCDCCGGYETEPTSVRVGTEDHCDECAEHSEHCDEHRALNLTASDWFTITGRGRVAVVDTTGLKRRITVGENVVIDGEYLEVLGIEASRVLTDPPIVNPSVGVVVPAAGLGGQP